MSIMATNNTPSKRRIVYMTDRLWTEAATTAQSLQLSTSQFLSRLVVEATPHIRPNSLLGLPLHDSTKFGEHKNAA